MSGRTPDRQTYTDAVDMSVKLQVFTCFYENCVLPLGGNSANVLADRRPDDFVYWRDPESWSDATPGFGGNYGGGHYGVPRSEDDVKINTGRCDVNMLYGLVIITFLVVLFQHNRGRIAYIVKR